MDAMRRFLAENLAEFDPRKYFKEKAKVNFKAIDEERVENTDADTNDNQKQSSDA